MNPGYITDDASKLHLKMYINALILVSNTQTTAGRLWWTIWQTDVSLAFMEQSFSDMTQAFNALLTTWQAAYPSLRDFQIQMQVREWLFVAATTKVMEPNINDCMSGKKP